MPKIIVFFMILLAAGCKARQENAALLGSVARSDDKPPAVLYHFGEFRHLFEYGTRQGSFSAGEWNEIGSTGASQLSYRRGLYASQHPAYNERYALHHTKSEQSLAPWMMIIHLKPECQTAERAEGNVLKTLYDPNSRFMAFLKRKGDQSLDDLAEFQRFCPQDLFRSYERQQAYMTQRDWKPLFERCNELITQYFDEENINVVYDAWWENQGFWYIRDLNCIEKIDASALGNMTALADIPDLWEKAPYADNTPRRALDTDQWAAGEGILNMLLRTYVLVDDPDAELLSRVARNITGDVYLTQYAKATADKAASCRQLNRYATFEDQVSAFLNRIDSNSQAFRDQFIKFVDGDLARLGANCAMPASPQRTDTPSPSYSSSSSRCPDDNPKYLGQGRSLQECKNLMRSAGLSCSNVWRSVSTQDRGDCCCALFGGSYSNSNSSYSAPSSSGTCPSDKPRYVGRGRSLQDCRKLATGKGDFCGNAWRSVSTRDLGDCCCGGTR